MGFFGYAFLAIVALLALGIFLFIGKQGTVFTNPAEVNVYKNRINGKLKIYRAGMDIPNPFFWGKLQTVTLRNEQQDPPVFDVKMSGMNVGVNLVISKFVVPDDDEAIIKAVTKINYADRVGAVVTKLRGTVQHVVASYDPENLLLDTAQGRRLNGEELKKWVDNAQQSLDEAAKKVEDDWGIQHEPRIENFIFPDKFLEVVEEVITSAEEGKKIRDKAAAAGMMDLNAAYTLDAYQDIARNIVVGLGQVLKSAKGGKR